MRKVKSSNGSVPLITLERLKCVIEELKAEKGINSDMRSDIVSALEQYEHLLNAPSSKNRSGRPIDISSWLTAGVAKALMEQKHATTVTEACTAAKKSSHYLRGLDPYTVTTKEVNSVKRGYEKLKNSDDGYQFMADGSKFCVYLLSDEYVNDAAVRLQKGMGDKGSGVSPHLMVGIIAILTEPLP